ncbi:MAG: hypothetical protein ACI9ES_003237 [Oceanospirillaceae bacterium]
MKTEFFVVMIGCKFYEVIKLNAANTNLSLESK